MAYAQHDSLSDIRKALGKNQAQLAELLGISVRAVQSYEQGWRQCPSYILRLAMMLRVMRDAMPKRGKACWEVNACPSDRRESCPGNEFGAGQMCWLITGTFCGGKKQKSWQAKAAACGRCKVFKQGNRKYATDEPQA